MDALPLELWAKIATCLDLAGIAAFSSVCQEAKLVCAAEYVWEGLCKTLYGELSPSASQDWKQAFKSLCASFVFRTGSSHNSCRLLGMPRTERSVGSKAEARSVFSYTVLFPSSPGKETSRLRLRKVQYIFGVLFVKLSCAVGRNR